MKENRNSSKHVEIEGSSLLLLILTSVSNDTNEFHLGGVSSGEQVLDFHVRKHALFKVLILPNTSSDNPRSRVTLAQSAVAAMKSWEREGCGTTPPRYYNPMTSCISRSGCTLEQPQWCHHAMQTWWWWWWWAGLARGSR